MPNRPFGGRIVAAVSVLSELGTASASQVARAAGLAHLERSHTEVCERCVRYGLMRVVGDGRPKLYAAVPDWREVIAWGQGGERAAPVRMASPNSVFDLGRFVL